LSAVRDDELAASSIGKSAQYYRFSAFLIAGMLSAAAGSLYAVSISLVDPTSFTLDESIFILMALSIGGSGNLVGPLVGTAVAVLLPEVLRLVPIEAGHAANIRQIIYGLLLILIIRLRPKGIAGVYDLS
jgi:branched-chain amino acid transport system permease protein